METVSIAITEADIVEAAKRHHRAAILSRRTALSLSAFTLVLVLFEATLVGYGARDLVAASWVAAAVAIGFPAMMYGVMAVVFLVLTPRRARRHFHENKALQVLAECSWTEDGLRIERPGNLSSLPWKDFLMVRDSHAVLMLYIARHLYIPLPKRCFDADELADIHARLAHAGVPRPKRW